MDILRRCAFFSFTTPERPFPLDQLKPAQVNGELWHDKAGDVCATMAWKMAAEKEEFLAGYLITWKTSNGRRGNITTEDKVGKTVGMGG